LLNRKKRFFKKNFKRFKLCLKKGSSGVAPPVAPRSFKNGGSKYHLSLEPLASNKKPVETITSGIFENSKTKQFSDVLTLNTDECSNKSSSSSIYKNTGFCFGCRHSLNYVQNGLSCEFCSYIYHLKCLDTNEICNEGSGESILFICNSCQKKINQHTNVIYIFSLIYYNFFYMYQLPTYLIFIVMTR